MIESYMYIKFLDWPADQVDHIDFCIKNSMNP